MEIGEDLLACKRVSLQLRSSTILPADRYAIDPRRSPCQHLRLRGGTRKGEKAKKFDTLEELRVYSKENRKFFPLNKAKVNTVLRAMLVEMSDRWWFSSMLE